MNAAETVSIYASRRRRLAEATGAGVAVVPTAAERVRNRDSHYPYRFDSHFYYLTGFTEPEAVLVLAGGRSILFCRERNESARSGTVSVMARRRRASASASTRRSRSQSSTRRCLACSKINRRSTTRWADSGWDARAIGWLNAVRAKVRSGVAAPERLQDVRAIIDDMRLHKDVHELGVMRRAARIAAAAHRRAMQRTRPGRAEYEIEAELLYEFRRNGAQFPAYSPIVAGGANACILHYVATTRWCAMGICFSSTRVRAGRLRLRHHTHLSGERPLHRRAARGLRDRARRSARRARDRARRPCMERAARRRGEGPGAGHD